MKVRHQDHAQHDKGKGRQHPEHDRIDHPHIAPPFGKVFEADAFALLPCHPFPALFHDGLAHHVEPGKRDHQRGPDAEAHPEVEPVGDAGRDGRHAGGPALQDAALIQQGVDHQVADNGPGKRPDDHVEGQHESDEQMPQVGPDAEDRRGQDGLDLRGEVDKWDRQDLHRIRQKDARQRGHHHVEQPPYQPDTGPRAEHAPAPPLLLGRGLGQRRGPPGLHRRQREGQPLDIACDPEHDIPERQPGHVHNEHHPEEEQDRFDPGGVNERPFGVDRRIQRRHHPVGDVFGQPLGSRRLDQVLVPDQPAEGAPVHMRYGPEFDPQTQKPAGHPVDHDQFLGLKPHERAFGNLQEEDDGHPLRSPRHALSGDQAEVDRPGQHYEAHEQGRPDSLQIETIFVGGILRHDGFVLF